MSIETRNLIAATNGALLWRDMKTDSEKANYILSGRAYATGILAHAIQNDVAMAYQRCANYAAHVTDLEAELAELRAQVPLDVESICNAYDIGMQSTDCINPYEHGTREHYAFSLGVERRYQLEYIAAQSTVPATTPPVVMGNDNECPACKRY